MNATDQSGKNSVEPAAQLTTAAEQAISGRSIYDSGTATCTYCKSEIAEGDSVTVYAYRRAGEQTVSVARLYCAGCDRTAIRHPARGCYEWLADVRIGLTSDVALQSRELTLVGVSIVAESGPENGGRR